MSTDVLDFQMNFEANEQSEADKKLFVKFYTLPVHQEGASIEAGRPIFKDEEHISIIAPGSRSEFVGKVDPGYIARFPQHYARFKAGQTPLEQGTPLTALPWFSPSQIAEYQALNVRTVEQLVGMSDAVAHRFMGFHGIKERARVWLELSQENAPAVRLQNELEKRDVQIAELQGQMATLVAQLQANKEKK